MPDADIKRVLEACNSLLNNEAYTYYIEHISVAMEAETPLYHFIGFVNVGGTEFNRVFPRKEQKKLLTSMHEYLKSIATTNNISLMDVMEGK